MDNDLTLSVLVHRVTVLEQSCKRVRCVAAALGAILACCILLAISPGPTVIGDPQGAHTEIAAGGVTVYDGGGKPQIFLGIGPNGRPMSKVGGIEQMGVTVP